MENVTGSYFCSEPAATTINRGAVLVADPTVTTEIATVKLPTNSLLRAKGVVDAANATGQKTLRLIIAGEAYIRSDGSSVIVPGDDLVIADTFGNVKPIPAGAHSDFDIIARSDAYVPAIAGALVKCVVNIYRQTTS